MKKFILDHKTKILLTLFFTLLLVLLNNNVFASDTLISFTGLNGITYDIPEFNVEGFDTSNGFFIKEYQNFSLVILGDNTSILRDYAGNIYIGSGEIHFFDLINGSWIHTLTMPSDGRRVCVESEIRYYSCPLYDYSSPDTVYAEAMPNFFWTPPQEGTLVEVLKNLKKEAVQKEIIALLPVILSVLVSLIPLRKALKVLSDFLRTS